MPASPSAQLCRRQGRDFLYRTGNCLVGTRAALFRYFMRNFFGDTVADRDAGRCVIAARTPILGLVRRHVRLDVSANLPHSHIEECECIW